MYWLLITILTVIPLLQTQAGALTDRATALGIPVALMSATNQALVQGVMNGYTLRREYAPRRFRGRQEHFEFMLDHMEACSALAERAGLISYHTTKLPDGRLVAENNEAASGSMQQVHCDEDSRTYYVEGEQRGMFTARGRGVVVVTFKQVTPEEIEYTGRLFVHIDNPVVATLAKVFFIFLRNAVDRNFDHVMRQPICLSELATDCPATLHAIIGQLPPDEYRLLIPFQQQLNGAAR